MIQASVGFIGGGRVTRILLGGWHRQGGLPEGVTVSDINMDILTRLKADFPGVSIAANGNPAAAAQDIVFLSLHPPAFAALYAEIRANLKPTGVVVSLAPRISLAALSTALGTNRIARMIPNAPSIVNAGYNPVSFSEGLDKADRIQLQSLFHALGDSPEVDEEKLEAYAILTAMGPAYFWFQLRELMSIGESFGLTREELIRGLGAMAVGAARTLMDLDMTPEGVMDLIPAKPLKEDEAAIRQLYRSRLEPLFAKLKGIS